MQDIAEKNPKGKKPKITDKAQLINHIVIRKCQQELMTGLNDYEALYTNKKLPSKRRAQDITNLKDIIGDEYQSLDELLNCVKSYLSQLYTGISIFGFWIYESGNSRLRSQYLEPVIKGYENKRILDNLIYSLQFGLKDVVINAELPSSPSNTSVSDFKAFWEKSRAVTQPIAIKYDQGVRERCDRTILQMQSMHLTKEEIIESLTTDNFVGSWGKTGSAPSSLSRKSFMDHK